MRCIHLLCFPFFWLFIRNFYPFIHSVFANLYYEFNNELLDFVFSEQSNLKCALYADTHTVVEKTNFGGQQSYPSPGPLTYIQDSSGWALSSLADPADPEGYELVFGPTNGANNAFSVSLYMCALSVHEKLTVVSC